MSDCDGGVAAAQENKNMVSQLAREKQGCEAAKNDKQKGAVRRDGDTGARGHGERRKHMAVL